MSSFSVFSCPSLLSHVPSPKPTTTTTTTTFTFPVSSPSAVLIRTPPLCHSVGRRNAFLLGILPTLPFLPPPPPPEAAAAPEAGSDQCSLAVAPSGLAFCDRQVGTGSAAMKGQLIKAHYTGMLENGKVFDSSYARGKPLTFRIGVGEVIKGWDQGILGGDGIPPMLAGGKRTLKLPPELGYGSRGAGCRGGQCIIPPDSTLLFEVEFIG